MPLTNFNMPGSADGGAVGAVATLTIPCGDVIASQTNLVIGSVQAPFDLVPLSIEICQRAIAGGTPTVGLYNSTDSTDIFANANTGATGVSVRNSTQVAGEKVVQKDDIMQVRATTAVGVTATGVYVVLTYESAGAPSNRTLT
jgi:hypothetical protein